jgi:ribosomal protein S18 acetylase RimI-like enzyme
MKHVLDNPAWNALISGNKHLSNGNEQVRYFDKEVSPFVGFEENSIDNFRVLYDLIPHNDPVGFITPNEMEIPGKWKVLQLIRALQMVYDDEAGPIDANPKLVPLTDEHVPQMLALAKLTNPGPFAERTIGFGHYHGIFEEDKLVAMAGQRLHVFDYTEVSAVCTHPDHTGRGYAQMLLLYQLQRIKAASGIPFLHVRYDNERAIQVYERLGFKTRKEIYFYILQKN